MEIFWRRCLQSHLQTSPPTPQKSYLKFRNSRTTFQNTPRLVGILIFLLLRSTCKISEPYDYPFWEKSIRGRNKRDTEKENLSLVSKLADAGRDLVKINLCPHTPHCLKREPLLPPSSFPLNWSDHYNFFEPKAPSNIRIFPSHVSSVQTFNSHSVSWCYIQLSRAEYILKLEKMAIVPGLLIVDT